MKKMLVPMEIKEVGETGTFSGYASIFGNVDLGGDVISKDEPFKEFVRNPDGKIVVLYAHDSGDFWSSTAAGGVPIGLADVTQNNKGLKFDAQLTMDDTFVRDRCYPAMKAKTLTGMSIGYDVLPGGATSSEINGEWTRTLTALKLWEISPCIWGMNPKAGIETVKSCPQFDTVRECEAWLRDELGFTHSAAKDFIARFRKALVRDEPPRDEAKASDTRKCIEFLQTLVKDPA